MTEHALLFTCGTDTLVGVLSLPDAPANTAVVIVVGGPQYRAGSHRQFVLLARTLAASGYAVLRFDYQGMGDSNGTAGDFLTASPGIRAAIDNLQVRVTQVEKIVLWGLCDGASAALLYMHETQDSRVAGLCLLNPWLRSETSLARMQVKHYYTQRLLQREFWTKLVSGKIAIGALKSLACNLRLSRAKLSPTTADNQPFQQRMAAAWMNFGGRILLLLSGKDYTAKEFLEYAAAHPEWRKIFRKWQTNRHDLPHADHTFSDPVAQLEVQKLTLHWLQSI